MKTERNIACLVSICTRAIYAFTPLHNDEFTNIIYVGLSDEHVHFFVCEFSPKFVFHVAQHICTDGTVSITFKHFENLDEFKVVHSPAPQCT